MGPSWTGAYVFCHPTTSGIFHEYAKCWKGKGWCPWRMNPKLKIGKNQFPKFAKEVARIAGVNDLISTCPT